MQKTAVTKIERAMAAASESFTNLKLFAEGLNKFLQANGLGSAGYAAHEFVELTDDHGYQIGMFSLYDATGKDVIYFYIYTDGTVWGENFTDDLHNSDINDTCTYAEAAKEVLKTIGLLNHNPLSKEKIEKAISALG